MSPTEAKDLMNKYHQLLRDAGFQYEGHAVGVTREDDLRPVAGKAREIRFVLWGKDGDARVVLQFWNVDGVTSWIAFEPIHQEIKND